jgi:hypothetical protein
MGEAVSSAPRVVSDALSMMSHAVVTASIVP